MFVLMSLILLCLQRACVLFAGTGQPSAPAVRAERVAKLEATLHAPPLAYIHAPTPRLIV